MKKTRKFWRAAMLLLMMMLTTTTAWALNVTVVPANSGTYNVVGGTKLYVTPNTGYYLYSVIRDGEANPLVEENGYYTVSDADDITITFKPYTNNVQVRFNMKGHGAAIADRDQMLGQTVERPTPDPTEEGYVFLGWFEDSNCTKPYNFNTPLDNTLAYDTHNDRYKLTLYAGWIAEADLSGTCGKVDATAKPPLDGSEVTWAVTKSAGSDNYDVLTISGSGEMTNYDKNKTPWNDFRNQIKTVVIDEGVTVICRYAFYDFVNVSSDITIPASVTSIGNFAFNGVSKNTTAGIHITAAEGSALTSIGGHAFDLANVSIDLSPCTSLTAISNDYVFRKVSHDVTLPSSVTSICKWAFNRYIDGAFLGDHAYVVVPDGKVLSVTIDEVAEPVVIEPTDGKADILGCLYADPANRGHSRALTLAAEAKDFTTDGHAGTEADPYIIYNKEQLDLLAQRVNSGESYSGKFFKLGKDIKYTHTTDWNDTESEENNYTTIGQRLSNNDDNPFSGTFDGDGHTVRGIRIYKSGNGWTDAFQGLFGYVENGTVKNVTLADARITGEQNVGGIVGKLSRIEGSPTIVNCHVLSNVTIHAVADESCFHGGIAGNSDGSVLHCTSAATLTIKEGINGCEDFGGIVGRAIGTLRHNMAIGCTIPAVDYSGAIAGENYNNWGTFEYNYYGGCTVGSATSNIGSYNADITANDGAVPAVEFVDEPVGSGYVTYNKKYYAPTCRTVVMNASGIRTLATVDNFDFKDIDGLTAYIVNAFNGTTGTLWLNSIEKVPAGTGLLLKGTASTTFVVPFTASAVAPTTNYLVGVTDGTTVVPRTEEKDDYYTNFILANGSQGINWYTLLEAGAIGAYKAYLSLPTDQLNLTSGAPSFTWVYGDGSTTAIEGPSPDPSLLYGGEWYDLNGRRLSGKPTTKGLYIHNGRKEVVR